MPVDHLLFRQSPWLQPLTAETVADLASKAIVRRLGDGELWISRSERANGIAIIAGGGLRSTTYTCEGREYVFSIMRKGDIWGLVSTIDGIHNANDVYAHGETTLITIDRRAVLKTIAERPDFSKCLMVLMCQRLRMASTVLEDRALKPIELRLARLLLSLCGDEIRAEPRRSQPGTEVAVTQEMLAKILGCTRPTVNKKLRILEEEGAIKVEYGRIWLLDMPRIIELSGEGEYPYF
ncbi:MAG TPA: Crp/Fnr family transcriptional regulator [Pararhizobium sp.]|nr:Crp/Fnr family transcriptional regulator [Pararhizobium sp.]